MNHCHQDEIRYPDAKRLRYSQSTAPASVRVKANFRSHHCPSAWAPSGELGGLGWRQKYALQASSARVPQSCILFATPDQEGASNRLMFHSFPQAESFRNRARRSAWLREDTAHVLISDNSRQVARREGCDDWQSASIPHHITASSCRCP